VGRSGDHSSGISNPCGKTVFGPMRALFTRSWFSLWALRRSAPPNSPHENLPLEELPPGGLNRTDLYFANGTLPAQHPAAAPRTNLPPLGRPWFRTTLRIESIPHDLRFLIEVLDPGLPPNFLGAGGEISSAHSVSPSSLSSFLGAGGCSSTGSGSDSSSRAGPDSGARLMTNSLV